MRLKSTLSGSELAASAGVGLINIATLELDNMQGWLGKPPFQNSTDIVRLVGFAGGKMYEKKGGKKGAVGEAVKLAETPLLLSSLWNAVRVYALKQPKLQN